MVKRKIKRKITAKLVDSFNLKTGNIVVICDDDKVYFIDMVFEFNKQFIMDLIRNYEVGNHEYYFLNFTRSAFLYFMKKAIKELKK